MKSFFLGVLAVVAVFLVIGYVGVITGTLIPANADGTPGKLERWAARQSLKATIAREAPSGAAPIPANDETLNAGIKIYGDNCIVCHGAADGRSSTVGFGLYQKAPLLGKHGVEDDPEGEIYWKVDHGIRLTGMPAFGHTLSDTQVWQVAVFLKHMDSLPPAPNAKWRALKNPAMLVPTDKLPKQMRPKSSG
ncbi:MAG: cytochrome c [Candidatus Eremiobacteraeota bacterium]|nr:cytochrome c [Candidatus Eremiobacteraeota bacterium]